MKRARRALTAVLALTAGLLGGTAATAPPAAAVTAPVAFTAEDLDTWQTNGIVWALAESGGTVFAGGTFSTIRPPGVASGGTGTRSAVNFAAFDAATGAPTSCSLSFTRTTGTATVRALAVSPDGETLYAGGYFTAVSGVAVNGLAAVDIDTCAARAAFNPAFNATVRALDVAPDGTVYAGGDFTTVRGTARQRFAALTPAGALTPWTADADLSGRAVEVTEDGEQVVLAGDFTAVEGTNSHALAVVDSGTGALEHAYPTGFIPASAVVKDLVTDGTGVYAAGEGMGGASFDGRIALNTGDWGQRWRDTCQGANQALAVYQEVLYSGHHTHDCSSMGWFPNVERKHFLAQGVNDPTLLAWAPDTNEGTGEQLGPRALTLADSGGSAFLWAAGEFTTVNGSAQQSLTRFGTGPDTGAPSTPAAWVSSETPGSVNVRWQASQDLDDGNLTYAVYRNGASTPIHTTTVYSRPWERPQLSWTDTSVTAGATYSYRITASDGRNTSALSTARSATAAGSADVYAARVRSDGASLYWRYDESSGTFAADSGGADDGGAYVSTPSYRQTPAAVPGSSTALGLNGTSEYVYSEKRHARPDTYTVETWFRTTTTSGGRIIGFGDNFGTGQGYFSRNSDRLVYMTNAGQLGFGTGSVRAGNQATLLSTRSYNDGAWHHVAATQGANGMALYVDGAQVGSNTVTTALNTTGFWRVGGDTLTGWPSNPTSAFFAGTVDETAVYPSALGAAQVAAHHALGTGSGGEESSVTVPASEDSYVNASATGTNYGTSTSLAVRGTSAYLSYLRFPLPAAPSGTELTSAVLRLRTTSLSTAGSADSFDVVPVTGDWTETGVTYANRPALSPTVLGTLAAPDAVSTDYEVALDTGGLDSLLGSTTSVALTSAGTDALWLWSGEYGTTEYRPELVLTFSPS
ncbi:LamG-like jellyroll fold domain-containing protein [Streptomyces sp. NBC_01373]|uniref:LamG-like jellyroll fold domain-containing protein n=1 Tax=unclassified Streptomyces TaxID=2593676 RepID=UPI00225A3537|nr:LamG-like jellyroll fold domain-containing protein [Streptomyces sp. NBC_01373]MCX4697558.1 DNRLRE domain-containing protein [Streptomyces sp. NBC_01373]